MKKLYPLALLTCLNAPLATTQTASLAITQTAPLATTQIAPLAITQTAPLATIQIAPQQTILEVETHSRSSLEALFPRNENSNQSIPSLILGDNNAEQHIVAIETENNNEHTNENSVGCCKNPKIMMLKVMMGATALFGFAGFVQLIYNKHSKQGRVINPFAMYDCLPVIYLLWDSFKILGRGTKDASMEKFQLVSFLVGCLSSSYGIYSISQAAYNSTYTISLESQLIVIGLILIFGSILNLYWIREARAS